MEILVAILGIGWLGFLATAVGWWRERSQRQQNVRVRMAEFREQLASKPELLHVIGILEAEAAARIRGEGFSIPNGVSPNEMRNLPAFLEKVGIFLRYQPDAPKDAYATFSKEVVLCHRSSVLWIGDGYSDTWWSDFKGFARETQKRLSS